MAEVAEEYGYQDGRAVHQVIERRGWGHVTGFVETYISSPDFRAIGRLVEPFLAYPVPFLPLDTTLPCHSLRHQANTEAQVVEPVGGRVPGTTRRPAEAGVDEPTAAAKHAVIP